MTSRNQGLREAEKRDPGNEVANFPGMRLPWECHVQSQEINLTSLGRNCLSLMKEIGQFAKVWDLDALTHRFLLKAWCSS